MNKKQKANLRRIIISAMLAIALGFVPVHGYYKLVLYLIPYLVVGYDILKKSGIGYFPQRDFR